MVSCSLHVIHIETTFFVLCKCCTAPSKLNLAESDGPFSVCLEHDGTVIEDDEALTEVKGETIMILAAKDVFISETAVPVSPSSCLSTEPSSNSAAEDSASSASGTSSTSTTGMNVAVFV